MGKYAKWIGGGLGWFLGGPLGALLGFAAGSIFDGKSQQATTTNYRGRDYRTTAGDFGLSLIVLVAAVMKADGKVVKSELDFVRNFFRNQFGEETAGEALLMLRDLLKQNIPIADVCRQISRNMEYASRLQLMHMLYGISLSDRYADKRELNAIEVIAGYLNITQKDRESIKNMFLPSDDAYYKILEINPSATDEEVKKAYRSMARKYHPDMVSHLGEDFREVANEKFRKVNEAYEKIKKSRNMS
ncbi:MAG: TerB family tellurite resistance protein [Bacteroidales bacterium]|nr:TerB family tellurite resistance protein [Bacteroidales bacterium]